LKYIHKFYKKSVPTWLAVWNSNSDFNLKWGGCLNYILSAGSNPSGFSPGQLKVILLRKLKINENVSFTYKLWIWEGCRKYPRSLPWVVLWLATKRIWEPL